MDVKNQTPYPHDTAVLYNAAGREVLVVMVKATLRLGSGAPATEPEKVRLADTFFPSGALRYPSDVALDRPGTDVICHGTVSAPRGLPQSVCTAELRVGGVRRVLRVFGRRTWVRDKGGWEISEPEPFEAVPLGFEGAFGGPGFAANPIGMGFWDEAAGGDPEGLELPHIEDDAALIQAPGDHPAPACFGAVAGHWEPRARWAGTYDDAWKRARAPLLPADFDPRFFCAAGPGLLTERPLVGGEPIELGNLTPTGHLEAAVPRIPIRLRIGGAWVRPALDRVVIEPDADRIILTYRASIDVTGRVDRLPGVLIVEKDMHFRDGAAP